MEVNEAFADKAIVVMFLFEVIVIVKISRLDGKSHASTEAIDVDTDSINLNLREKDLAEAHTDCGNIKSG